MDKKIFIVLFASIVLIGLILSIRFFEGNDQRNSSDNRELITEIQGYINNAKYHPECLNELRNIAKKIKYNHQVIKNAAYFVSKAGFNTWTVMKIAQLANDAHRDVKYLNDLLEVSITYNADSLTIIHLAERAVYKQISAAELEEKISYYRDNSKWKTIDETIENEEKNY